MKKEGCRRSDCFPCTSGGGNCEKSGSGYQIRCETCHLDGVSSLYEGETGRNAYTRGKEHLDALRLETVINKRGTTWKKLDDAVKESMNTEKAITVATDNPSIIKRPILQNDNFILAGFKADEWKDTLN